MVIIWNVKICRVDVASVRALATRRVASSAVSSIVGLMLLPSSSFIHCSSSVSGLRCCQIPHLFAAHVFRHHQKHTTSLPNQISSNSSSSSMKNHFFMNTRDLCFTADSKFDPEIDEQSDADVREGFSGVDSNADPEEVNKVCKLIDQLFALDRNMEAVLNECRISLSPGLVVAVLERFKHPRKPAYRLFCWAGDRPGYAHDSTTYNAMMSIFGRRRQFEAMVSFLHEIGEKGLLSMDTFTIAIKAFAAAKERKKAVGMFELMNRYKFEVSVETINVLLDNLGRAKLVKEADALFQKLKDSFGPDMRTYTALLSGWCKVKISWRQAESGMRWLIRGSSLIWSRTVLCSKDC